VGVPDPVVAEAFARVPALADVHPER
jgi:hypothetical protein